MEDRTALNRQLAQMLKGGVIMDVTTPNRHVLQKPQVPAQLWHWNVFLPTSVLRAAFRV